MDRCLLETINLGYELAFHIKIIVTIYVCVYIQMTCVLEFVAQ